MTPLRSTREAIDALDGRLSFRMLDYWLRTGVATITHDARGSGTRRQFTDAEVAAISDVADAQIEALAVLERVSSGELYAERRAHHEQAATQLHLVSEYERPVRRSSLAGRPPRRHVQ
ncbi:MAG: hypothetical protein ABI862_18445 [Ilumatobacteraceae bacterium]